MISREQNGRARKYVLKYLGIQERRAIKKKKKEAKRKRGRALKQSSSGEPISKKRKGPPRPKIDASRVNPDALIGARINKHFENFGVFVGEVISHDVDESGEAIYRIKYTDGDEEDLFFNELEPLLSEPVVNQYKSMILTREIGPTHYL